MKTGIKQLLRDLKVAATLGRPDAIDIALNGLLALPGVSSNDRMEEGFIEQVILPVGKLLTSLKSSQLRPLLDHPLAVGRAIGAAALAYRFLEGKDVGQKDLRKPAGDARSDVRIALGRTLFAVAETAPEKLLTLGTTWIMQPAPKLRHTALIFLPALGFQYGPRMVGLLGPLGSDDDRDVRAALVDALNHLAQSGLAESVLGLLALWGSEGRQNSWVICRVLSASWVADHPAEAESILRDLVSKIGETSEISNALKALKRHGVEIEV
jgi:hypothetical protein